jgi:hypothetical protein
MFLAQRAYRVEMKIDDDISCPGGKDTVGSEVGNNSPADSEGKIRLESEDVSSVMAALLALSVLLPFFFSPKRKRRIHTLRERCGRSEGVIGQLTVGTTACPGVEAGLLGERDLVGTWAAVSVSSSSSSSSSASEHSQHRPHAVLGAVSPRQIDTPEGVAGHGSRLLGGRTSELCSVGAGCR